MSNSQDANVAAAVVAKPLDAATWIAQLDAILHDVAAGHSNLDRSHAAGHLNDLRAGRVHITVEN